MTRSAWAHAMVLALAFLLGAVLGGPAQARRVTSPSSSTSAALAALAEPAVALSSLPVQAQEVQRRILAGGPFTYLKDGIVFGNREHILPRRARGFYHEYTVPTPGERERGARRIVCGGKDARQPETCFYTKDHYQSFQPIDPNR